MTGASTKKNFGIVQKDLSKELKRWSDEVTRLNDHAKLAVIAANNHYAGFGPATANSFREMVGVKEPVWEEIETERIMTARMYHTFSSSHFSTKLVFVGAQDESLELGWWQ